MNPFIAFLLLQSPQAMNPVVIHPDGPDTVIYPSHDRMTVSARCPQGAVRIVVQVDPPQASPRVLELRVGRRRLPRAQLALIDQALGAALIDTIHIRECINPPDSRIRIQIRVERMMNLTQTVTELVTFFIDNDRISVVP